MFSISIRFAILRVEFHSYSDNFDVRSIIRRIFVEDLVLIEYVDRVRR